MEKQPPVGWDCLWCGARNGPDIESCQGCHVIGNARGRTDMDQTINLLADEPM